MSGYTTEEEYLDHDDEIEITDAVYGGPYGPPYNCLPQARHLLSLSQPDAAAAPPADASASSDKGKGKAKEEGAEAIDSEIKERKEEGDTPERQANKEQLTKLAAVSQLPRL
jgi:hypothetical protein